MTKKWNADETDRLRRTRMNTDLFFLSARIRVACIRVIRVQKLKSRSAKHP